MRSILFILIIFSSATSRAQTFSYPLIKEKGQRINDFIPSGWMLLDSAIGDLNKDGADDAAIVLQTKDSITIVKGGDDTVITQPRILLILFRNASTNSFYIAEQSNSFILNHDNPARDDPYQEMWIINGVLQIKFHLFYNMGSWYISNYSYSFRYQKGEFVLIGADYNSFHRATADFEEYSYNFLTKKRSLKKGNENEGKKDKTIWKTFDIKELKTLQSFKEPFRWEVESDVYL